MAQISIREFDAKNMYFLYIGEKYTGIQIKDLKEISKLSLEQKYIVKPDMLFGKRGKRGLLGLNLSENEVNKWLKQNYKKTVCIDGVNGELNTFLIEPFDNLVSQYYISFCLERGGDKITFSLEGGVEIEDNWETTLTLLLPVTKELKNKDLDKLGIPEKLKDTIKQLFKYYREYGFVYLEVNPLSINDDGKVCVNDMVAKVDDMEEFRQKFHWKDLEIPQSFGYVRNVREEYIRKLDSQTGASMKFKVLNKDAKIWTLLAGGGGSLTITDTLGALGFSDDIGNYGELSGDPDRENTREYTRCLIEQMLENKVKNKYLIIAGAIANFTHIDKTFAGIIDVFEEKVSEIKAQNIIVLVRRGGINDKKGLKLMKDSCVRLGIPCKIADSSVYMTDILKEIKL